MGGHRLGVAAAVNQQWALQPGAETEKLLVEVWPASFLFALLWNSPKDQSKVVRDQVGLFRSGFHVVYQLSRAVWRNLRTITLEQSHKELRCHHLPIQYCFRPPRLLQDDLSCSIL